MELIHLDCDGFRGLSGLRFEPAPALNVLRGHNAQGKTTILEAVFFLATSKSHRTASDSDLVQHGKREFHVQAEVHRKDRPITIEAHWWQGVKRFRINGVAQPRVSEILGKLHVVFFSPEDIGLVRDSAMHRRRFLDVELSQINPAYLYALQQYRQVIRQRNEVLRSPAPDTALLDAWDDQLSRHGTVLMRERQWFLERLAAPAAAAYARIAHDEPLEVVYRPDVRDGAPLDEVLRAARTTDIRQSITTRGPHRDDVEFLLDGRPARHFASQGQQRTAALALRLAEVDLVHTRTGEYPILMLDDVLSELDARRAHRLIEAARTNAQCLLTTTGFSAKDDLFGAGCTYFVVRNGTVVRQ